MRGYWLCQSLQVDSCGVTVNAIAFQSYCHSERSRIVILNAVKNLAWNPFVFSRSLAPLGMTGL